METTHRDLSDETNPSFVALAVWKRELKEYQKCNKIIMEAYGCTEILMTRLKLLKIFQFPNEINQSLVALAI